MKGTVKFYNAEKGYGFIKGSDGEYFVHVKDFKNIPHGRVLKGGEIAEFEPQQNDKGKAAKNVYVSMVF